MREKEIKLLFELLKNSKRSDRDIAKILGVSQPTITRLRTKLQKEGVIREYTIIPDWEKIGYELTAFTYFSLVGGRTLNAKARECAMERPNVIFASGGEGMGMNGVMISMHKDYSDFLNFTAHFRMKWAENLKSMQSFVVTLKPNDLLMIKPFSYSYLAKTEI